MISFDTNVLIYAFDFDAVEKQARANALVSAGAKLGSTAITLQVLTEFHAVARRKGMSIDDALGFVARIRKFYRVIAPDEEAFDRGVRAMSEHRLHIWDAMLWATLDQAGCRTLLTEDFQDGRTLGGVTFLNPFNPANDEKIGRLTRPIR